MIGLDTTAIIDIFKNEKSIISLLLEIEEQISSTQINYQEIMFGLDLTKEEHKKEKEKYDNFFKNVIYFTLSDDSVVKASEIFWGLKRQKKEAERFDSMIAGILLSNGINKIITKNVKHFENIKGLEVISY